MSIKIVEVRELKKGNYIVIDGEPCKIIDYSSSKPGKHGSAKVRIEGSSIFDGRKKAVLTSGSDKTEVPIITRQSHQVLSINGNIAQLMNTETFENIELPIPEGVTLQEGTEIMVMDAMNRKMIMLEKE